jgi:hypothetical protein
MPQAGRVRASGALRARGVGRLMLRDRRLGLDKRFFCRMQREPLGRELEAYNLAFCG